MNKNFYTTIAIVVGVVVVAGLVLWSMKSNTTSPAPEDEPVIDVFEPQSSTPTGSTDSTSSINQSLNELDLGDLDAEFQQVDADLNSL